MKEPEVIVGEFENESYAEIAKRDLRVAGINVKILKDHRNIFLPELSHTEGVMLIIPDSQVAEARKILNIRFI
jgi:hypothetical protein